MKSLKELFGKGEDGEVSKKKAYSINNDRYGCKT